MTPTIAVIKEIVAHIRTNPPMATELADDADLVGEVGLDSLELLQFMFEVEARLGIVIDFEKLDYAHLRSIAAVAAFFETMPPRHANSRSE